ncbi:MAG: class I SAM-dependent methyltransferase [Fulvimonas sp.]|nr:class I SAM-dependent methyltransferase [Fulvimonas sp.]
MAELRTWWRRLSGKSRHALVGRPELWRMKRAFQIEFLRAHGLRPTQTVVDIGCGSLRGGIALIDYLEAGRYVGIDVRAEVLAEARRELARERLEHKRPRLIHAQTLSSVRLDTPADVCWAFSVLFHMSDAILEESLAWVARQLAVDGVFYANVIAGEGPPGTWQGFPVMARPLETYQSLSARHGLVMDVLGRLDTLGHHSGDPSQDGQWMLAFRPRGA